MSAHKHVYVVTSKRRSGPYWVVFLECCGEGLCDEQSRYTMKTEDVKPGDVGCP